MNKQKLLLTILAGVFVLALGYAFWATPRQEKISDAAPRRPTSNESSKGAQSSVATDEMRVRLELLTRENGNSPNFKRNIFYFWQPTPKPLPLPPPPPPAPPAVSNGPAPDTEEVHRELARFTFLGFLLKDGIRTIFLSANEEIFVVKTGDRFGKNRRFVVAELTPEKLTIRQDDDPRPIIIPLVEQAPLVEAPSYSPGQEPAAQTAPTRRRRPLMQERTDAEQQPAEQPESGELPVPIELPEATATPMPPEPTEPAAPGGEKAPGKDPFAIELKPPQGAAPQ